jgi:DNA-directed RNA polymerase subunit K/omega
MPPKKLNLKSQKEKKEDKKEKEVKEEIVKKETTKIIKVNKIDDKTSKNKISIIKSKKTITEPILENEEDNIIEVDEKDDEVDEKDDEVNEVNEVDKVDEVDKVEDKDNKDDEDDEDKDDEDKDDKDDEDKDDEDKEDDEVQEVEVEAIEEDEKQDTNIKHKNKKIERPIIKKEESKVLKKDKKTIEKEENQKNHNHSKPKTISISTKVNNKVDMFEEDDLDFRYVMMNYDFTKNKSEPKITKYEKALLIGKRAKQIEGGANPNVKYQQGQSVISIAEEELRQRKIPFFIRRTIGNKIEYWKPADMEVNMD